MICWGLFVNQGTGFSDLFRNCVLAGVLLLGGCIVVCAQNSVSNSSQPSDATAAAIQELQQQVRQLRDAMGTMQAENRELRGEVQRLQGKATQPVSETASYGGSSAGEVRSDQQVQPQTVASPSVAGQPVEGRIAALEETTQLLNSKLDDQYQTKVESGSKYRIRLSGLVLFNLFSNHGATDNQDIPSYATGPNYQGDFGATVRQSEIGLEAFGPTVAGAKTSATLQADFAGGFPETWNGVNMGIFRLRTASARMDWESTSIVAGQDELFISPFSPSSYASLAIPAFNYSGNLWAWTPQLRVEHRFDVGSDEIVSIQGGILDNLAGEFPAGYYFRNPGPGESSGQPAYAARMAWSQKRRDLPFTLGVAGYYGRQDWGNGRNVDSWAGLVDYQVPLVQRLSLSGEFYRGRSLGGLNGEFGQSVVYEGNPMDSTTPLRGLDTVGGWSQLKLRATAKLEFNAGFGMDNPTASEARLGIYSEQYIGPLFVQNRSELGNFIYRPRSNLLFSAEYRHLHTVQIDSPASMAQQFNFMMGIFF
jgi:hypothetical protein